MAPSFSPEAGVIAGCNVTAFTCCGPEALSALRQGFDLNLNASIPQALPALSATCKGGCSFLIQAPPPEQGRSHRARFVPGSSTRALRPGGVFLGYEAQEEEVHVLLRHASPAHFPTTVCYDIDETILHALDGVPAIKAYMKDLNSGTEYGMETHAFCEQALSHLKELQDNGRVVKVIHEAREDRSTWHALNKAKGVYVAVHWHHHRVFVVRACTAGRSWYGNLAITIVNNHASLFMPPDRETSCLSTEGQFPKYIGAAVGIVSQQQAWDGVRSARQPLTVAVDDRDVWAEEGVTRGEWEALEMLNEDDELREQAVLKRLEVLLRRVLKGVKASYERVTRDAARLLALEEPLELLLQSDGHPFEGFTPMPQMLEQHRQHILRKHGPQLASAQAAPSPAQPAVLSYPLADLAPPASPGQQDMGGALLEKTSTLVFSGWAAFRRTL
ncbi:hypothetical protein WJX73_000959 [Symbiochloris irregularis]|uniref:Uncharacterized protein n=1 Tax=Symbiochloris irregularis TaxID=706552 RepID=A0AAW1NZ31_9CHLO